MQSRFSGGRGAARPRVHRGEARRCEGRAGAGPQPHPRPLPSGWGGPRPPAGALTERTAMPNGCLSTLLVKNKQKKKKKKEREKEKSFAHILYEPHCLRRAGAGQRERSPTREGPRDPGPREVAESAGTGARPGRGQSGRPGPRARSLSPRELQTRSPAAGVGGRRGGRCPRARPRLGPTRWCCELI